MIGVGAGPSSMTGALRASERECWSRSPWCPGSVLPDLRSSFVAMGRRPRPGPRVRVDWRASAASGREPRMGSPPCAERELGASFDA